MFLFGRELSDEEIRRVHEEINNVDTKNSFLTNLFVTIFSTIAYVFYHIFKWILLIPAAIIAGIYNAILMLIELIRGGE